ncbi:hypothetical protein SDC9_137282 [bioreactor metagenome]|uniref:Uncharacterized protein n=1 Tax=bioreactor metagenome TaxID=1076179 RepID=A0A645DLM4_9ZZZZ
MGSAANGRFKNLRGVDLRPVPHGAVPHHGVGSDDAVPADDGVPPQNGSGQEEAPPADLHPGVDIHGGGVQHPHAACKVPPRDLVPQVRLHVLNVLVRVEGDPALLAVHILQKNGGGGFPPLRQGGALGGIDVALARPGRRNHRPRDHDYPLCAGDKVQQRRVSVRQLHVGLRRKAGPGLLGILRPADNKKPLYAVAFQLAGHPCQDGAKQNVFQHQRFSLLRVRGSSQENNCAFLIHRYPLPEKNPAAQAPRRSPRPPPQDWLQRHYSKDLRKIQCL